MAKQYDQQKVEIVSKSFLKPTYGNGSTESHPKTHTLSLFDQFAPPMYIPVIFFYSTRPSSTDDTSRVLRASLAATLGDFYPLAGRIRGARVVDCNDEGVVFVEARVSTGCYSSASEFLGEHVSPSDESLRLLGPDQGRFGSMEVCGSIPMAIQVTTFGDESGDLAVYVSFAHSILDMAGVGYFLKTWAAKAVAVASSGGGGMSLLSPPEFNIAEIYPPVDESSMKNDDDIHIIVPSAAAKAQPTANNPAYARIVFDDPMIKALKRAARSEHVQNPTANEAIIGLIHLIAIKANPNHRKDLTQAANLRSRVVPPLPERAAGNFISSYTMVGPTAEEATLAGIVSEIRKRKCKFFDAIQAMDKDELRLVTLGGWRGAEEDRLHRCHDNNESSLSAHDNRVAKLLMVTNWCGFGLPELDFGWGNPVCVIVPAPRRDMTLNGVNTSIMVDKKCGKEGSRSIEVYVILEEEEMRVFLSDEKLLAFGRINPHPFD